MRCSSGQSASRAAARIASTSASCSRSGGWASAARTQRLRIDSARVRWSSSVASAVSIASASVRCTSPVATPRARARSVKSVPVLAASSATRQASRTSGRNSWANARWPRTSCPLSVQRPRSEPRGLGTSVEPASARAVCTVTSGLSPADSTRNTLTINGAGAPSASSAVTMIEVLDCSPDRTLALRMATRPTPSTGLPCAPVSTLPWSGVASVSPSTMVRTSSAT